MSTKIKFIRSISIFNFRTLFIVLIVISIPIIGNQIFKAFNNYQVEANKKAWSDLVRNHPYSNRPALTKEEWRKVPATDRPDLAMEQDFLMTMDPALGYVPAERKIQANIELAKALKYKASITGVKWQERGPNNVGGRTRALMFDPNDANNGYKKVWAAGVSGGLWYTNDITEASPTWNHVNDFWENIAVSCIAYNPNNTQEFYVGTGEGWFNADAQIGGGIWKTTDGGSTWSHLANTTPGGYVNSTAFQYVNKIVIKADGTIFAATRGYYTNRGGLLRSIDGGSSWEKVVSIYVADTYRDWAADIEVAANGDLYASFGIFSAGQVYKSINANNGASGTWTNLSANIGMGNAERIELACAPSDAAIIYAVARGGSGDDDVEWFKKSIDGGTTWTSCVIPIMVDGSGNHFTRSQAFYNLILAVHPTNPNFVIAGGIDLHRTLDGGASWSGISHWHGGFDQPYVHADLHAIQFRPGASDEILFGSDGGIAFSSNAGNAAVIPSFKSKNSSYNVTQFYTCAAKNEIASNYFLGGTQDNGSQKFTSPQIGSTTEVTGGDGGFCHIDQIDPNIQTTSVYYNIIYRSLDGGLKFSRIINQRTGLFINPSEYDSQRKILYSSSENDTLKRVTGFDGSFSASDLAISVGNSKVSALKISPYSDNLFLGIANGRIYKYANASTESPSLIQIDMTLPVSGWVSSIDIGVDDNNILITFSNYGIVSVWETVDGGATWNNKEGNLPDIPIRWALYNPNNRDEVLLATELGVWSTDNFQSGTANAPDWGASNTNLAHTRCTMLKYRAADKMVVVSTHGRGLFTTDIFVENSVADFAIDNQTSCSGNLMVSFTDGSLIPNNNWAWDIDNDGTTDYTTQNPTHTYSSPGLYSVKLTINNGGAFTVKEKLILVMNNEPTVNANVADNSNLNNDYGIGIFRFALETIDNTTSFKDGAYQNYTCSKWTALNLNKSYDISIQTGIYNAEGARVYIDYNDNGIFESGESITTFAANKDGFRTASFTTPSSGVITDKGLRLRVLSKFYSIPINGTDVGDYGQAEDYTVYFTSDANWTGTSSKDWNTTGNWSSGTVPTSGINVIIPTGLSNYPIITGNVICNNLTIRTGASLTVNPGKAITVAGIINNEAGIAGLVLKSDATGNGSLIFNEGTPSATVERYIEGYSSDTGDGWHLISSPMTSFTVAGSSFVPIAGDDDLYEYDETTNNWMNYLNDYALNFVSGKGYLITKKNTITTNFSGTLNASDVQFNNLSLGSEGWHLLGNPYSSSIIWNETENNWDLINIAGTAKIWNGTGNYLDVAANAIIPSTNGFFVQATNASNAINIREASRTHNTGNNFKNETINKLVAKISNDANNYSDLCVVGFKQEATLGFDLEFDSHKLYGNSEAPQLSSKQNEEVFSTNYLPQLVSTYDLNLEFKVGADANYKLLFEGISSFDSDIFITLEDLQLQAFTNLNNIQEYNFSGNTTDNPDRFVIHFFKSALGVKEQNGLNLQVYSSNNLVYVHNKTNSTGLVQIFDLSGKKIFEDALDKSERSSYSVKVSSGAYLVIVEAGNQIVREKIIFSKQ